MRNNFIARVSLIESIKPQPYREKIYTGINYVTKNIIKLHSSATSMVSKNYIYEYEKKNCMLGGIRVS